MSYKQQKDTFLFVTAKVNMARHINLAHPIVACVEKYVFEYRAIYVFHTYKYKIFILR